MKLVPDDAVSEALNYLARSSRDCAAARGMRVRLEFKRKQVRARLVLSADQSTAGARDAWAESHPDYIAACEAEANSVEQDEMLRAERNKAEVILDCWRTEQASNRAGSSFK